MDMDLETYLKDRAEPQIVYYENGAGRAKKAHFRLQTAIIVLGVLVPVLINLPDWGPWVRETVTAISLSLPILVGIANLRKHGELWISYRTSEELLKSEKYLFLTRCGRYRDNPAATAEFIEAVEAILGAEHNKFQTVFDPARQQRETSEENPSNTGG